MKRGLVLEGGAYRGMYTCGVMDVMMENQISFDGIVGVSAGACFGVNYKSHQIGRALRYNQRFARDDRYAGKGSLLKTGNLFNAEFCYHVVPTKYDIFDFKTFHEDPTEFYGVVTDVETGEAVYHLFEKDEPIHTALEWIRASASLPLVSRIVKVGGGKYLDGGLADSIPLQFMEQKGFEGNVVILTQPDGYVKEPNKAMPLIRLWLHRHPRLLDAAAKRHEMYNNQLEYVAQQEKAGNIFVFRPEQKLEIGHFCKDPLMMKKTYNIGHRQAQQQMDALQDFLKNS